MKRQVLILAAGLLLLASASNAQAFELFGLGRGHGGHGCCGAEASCCAPEPTCCEAAPVCAPEPTCCAPEPTCCEPEPTCCAPRRCRLFSRLHAWKHKFAARRAHRGCCQPEPSCCEPEPTCCGH